MPDVGHLVVRRDERLQSDLLDDLLLIQLEHGVDEREGQIGCSGLGLVERFDRLDYFEVVSFEPLVAQLHCFDGIHVDEAADVLEDALVELLTGARLLLVLYL